MCVICMTYIQWSVHTIGFGIEQQQCSDHMAKSVFLFKILVFAVVGYSEVWKVIPKKNPYNRPKMIHNFHPESILYVCYIYYIITHTTTTTPHRVKKMHLYVHFVPCTYWSVFVIRPYTWYCSNFWLII